MNVNLTENLSLDDNYREALYQYISDGSESVLHQAYELGRKALDRGYLILQCLEVHNKILGDLVSDYNEKDKLISTLQDTASFLNEFLSPFEMTYRGFFHTVKNLKIEIAERERAENALRLSEIYYKSLIENTLDIITILSANGDIKFKSPSAEKALGYSPEELFNKNIFSLIHPDDVEEILEIFKKGTGIQEYTLTAEFRIRHKNGQWVILESIGKNMLDDPVIKGVIVNSRDITYKRTLEAIRRKYEFIVNASKELMGLVNKDYRYEAVNEAFCKALSKHRVEIIGKHIGIILGSSMSSELMKSHIDECFEGKVIHYEDWFNLSKIGKRYFEIDYYPYKNESGVITHVVVVKHDITDRRLAEQSIIQSELKYRRLFETSIEGLILLDGESGIIIDANPFILKFLDYTKEDFLGKKVWEIDAVKNIPETQLEIKDIIKKESNKLTQLELCTRKNKIVMVEFISNAYSVNYKKVIQCHLWDITERNKLQQQLNNAARQRANDLRKFALSIQNAQEEERKRIARELHDDICQRLTALRLQVAVVEDSIKGEKNYSKQFSSYKSEIDDLISEVRRISSNLRPSALDHFGLVTALKSLISEYEEIYSVRAEFKTEIPTFKHFNPDIEIALYRIAQEALTNYVKYSEAENVFVDLEQNENKLILSVKDNGVGFDPENYLNSGNRGHHYFGLINMRERTELLRGTFKIKSSPGRGVDIKVIIPDIEYRLNEKD